MAKLGDINSQTEMGVSYERYTTTSYGGQISAGTPQEIEFFTFTMPFTGVILVNGIARFDVAPSQPTTPMNALIDVGPTSTPAAATNVQYVGPTLNAAAYEACIPFSWKWTAVPVSTAVRLKIKYSCNVSAALLNFVSASARIFPAEF